MKKDSSIKVAMIQMKVLGNDVSNNMLNAERLIKKAAEQGADIAILPECMDIGWTHPGSLQNATSIPGGEVYTALNRMAITYNIFICSGMTERDGEKVFNTAVFIDNKGQLLLKHRKINELDIGKPYYSTGDRINIADTVLGRMGVIICADAIVEDHSILTAIAHMQPRIILSPCAWAVPPGFDNIREPYGDLWRGVYMPVAEKFGAYIFGVSNVGDIVDGPWKGWSCIGASIAIDNKGKQITQLPFGVEAETIEYVICD